MAAGQLLRHAGDGVAVFLLLELEALSDCFQLSLEYIDLRPSLEAELVEAAAPPLVLLLLLLLLA